MLQENGIDYKEGDMFEIFKGQENADTYDFVTPCNKSIDIKTASLPFHSRIMVPMSQFHLRKDFYVGIKLLFLNLVGRTIEPMNIDFCDIYGYVEREILEKKATQYFGEGNCKAYPLVSLKPIDTIIQLFKIRRV